MASQLKWNGKQFEQMLKKATADGLKRAGVFYHSACQQAVSKPNTGKSIKVKKRIKVRIRKDGKTDRRFKEFRTVTRTIYPNPSLPGESPRLRTGFGRKNVVINHDPKGRWVRIGVSQNGMYMFLLEVGTRRVARRPWLLKTLMENQQVIGALAATGGRSTK
jgi:hypothetical protein